MIKSRYKDAEKYYKTKRASRKRYYQQTANAKNNKKGYTEEEIEKILKHEKPDRELAEELGRSMKAIQHVRERYKNKG